MDFNNICCTCLGKLPENALSDASVFEKLFEVIPEMKYSVADCKLCERCISSIEAMHEFRRSCLECKMVVSEYLGKTNVEVRDVTGDFRNGLGGSFTSEQNFEVDTSNSAKTETRTWNLDNLTEAVLAIENGHIKNPSIAAKRFNVPKTALTRRLHTETRKPRKEHNLTVTQENHRKITTHLLKTSRKYQPDQKELKRFFYGFVEKTDALADYFRTIQKVQSGGCDNYLEETAKKNIPPSRIFSVGKLTTTYVPRKRKTWSDIPETLTAFFGTSSIGRLPVVVHRKAHDSCQFHVVNDAQDFYSDKDDLVVRRWLEIFAGLTGASENNKAALILDRGFVSYDLVEFCRRNGILPVFSEILPIGEGLMREIKYRFGRERSNYGGSVMELLEKIFSEVFDKEDMAEAFRAYDSSCVK